MDVALRWRRFLEFYDHRETRIRATAQVMFAGVVDSHRAQQELIELLFWVRDRWWLRLSPEDVDSHDESVLGPQAFLELPCPVRRRMHAERALIRLEQHFGSQPIEFERNMAEQTRQEVGVNCAEITSAIEAVAANNAQLVAQRNVVFEQRDMAFGQTVREEFYGYCARIAVEMQEDIPADFEARIVEVRDFFRGQFNEGVRRVEQHAREHCETFAAALREDVYRKLILVEDSNDCCILCGFLRVLGKSLLWLWLLREITVENIVDERETVFCATGIQVSTVPYLNESYMSVNVSNEVRYKPCSLCKSIYSVLQRDHLVCFGSHSGSPADPVLCKVNCPGNFSRFCGGDSWYTFHLMYLWVALVEADLFWIARVSWEQRANVHDSSSRLFQRDCSSHHHVPQRTASCEPRTCL